MTTYNTRRKKGFRCLSALVTVITLALPYLAFGASQSFVSSGSSTASRMHGQPSFSHRFHRFGFFGEDGLDDQGDQQVVIIQQPSAPTAEPSEPIENRIYVQPHWVDGGYGVQVLQPGYWTVPKPAAEH